MAEELVEGVQLPSDGSGKLTGAFKVLLADGNTVYVPATMLVDRNGFEIGHDILTALNALVVRLERLEELATLSTAVLTG